MSVRYTDFWEQMVSACTAVGARSNQRDLANHSLCRVLGAMCDLVEISAKAPTSASMMIMMMMTSKGFLEQPLEIVEGPR